MGDFLAPKRRDVVDRLRRRIENYRTHNNHSYNRFNLSRVGLYEQQKQETELIHQKWLESKSKKAPKQSKAKDTGGGGGTAQADHRNLVNKLKQKIDATSNNNENTSASTQQQQQQQQQQQHHQQQQQAQGPAAQDTVFRFEDESGVTSQGAELGGGGGLSSSTNVGVTGGVPDFFVQIEQQISSQRKSPQTIHTSVRVSSTPFPPSGPSGGAGLGNSDSSPATLLGGGGGSINIHTSTSAQPPHGASISTATTTNISTGAFKSNNNNVSNVGSSGLSSSVQHASTETCAQSDIECKQEPDDSRDSFNASGTGEVPPDLPFDEIQNILDQIETDSNIDLRSSHANNPGLLRDLNDFYQVLHKVSSSSGNGGGDLCSLLSLDSCVSPGLPKSAALYADTSPHSHIPVPSPSSLTPTNMFEAPQPLGGMGAMGMRAVPPLAEPTGPAAEYLKQMAAQHQHQAAAAAAPSVFPSKGFPDQYSDPYDPFGRSRNGYPAGYTNQGYAPSAAANATAGYPGYGQTGFGDCSPGMAQQYPGSKPELASIGYSQTKPLTHYPGDAMGGHGGQPGAPSSLQQLQNQVASHFNPMHITQTQHVQLGQGPHRLQMSQTQQMQMSAAAAQQQPPPMVQSGVPPGMAVSQQQSFGMMNQGQSINMREMQLMQEKMRREQQQQQQQQQQQYMTRPPPEYKMHPAARPSGPPYPAPSAAMPTHSQSGSTTPLQTMQNMVNQTPPYPGIKGEAGGSVAPAGGPGTSVTHMTAVQSMTSSVNTAMGHNGGMNSSMAQASQSMSFQQQQQQSGMPQRPPSYSPHAPASSTPNGVVPTTTLPTTTAGGGLSNGGNGLASGAMAAAGGGGAVSSSPSTPQSHSVPSVAMGVVSQSASSNSYTSALMRNQRPPNVNVGPEGLNISQPRAHLGHPGHMGHSAVGHQHSGDGSWPRGGVMSGHHAASLSGRGGPMGGSPVGGMGQNMLPPGYSHRPGSAGAVPGMGGLGGSGGGQGHPMMGGMGTPVMMHQNVQMTQQQQQHIAMRQSLGVPAAAGMQSHSAYNPMAMQAGSGHSAQQQQTPQAYGVGLGQQDDFMQQFFSSEQAASFDSISSDLFEDILK